MKNGICKCTAIFLATVILSSALLCACEQTKPASPSGGGTGSSSQKVNALDYEGKPFTVYIGSSGVTAEDIWVEEDDGRKTDDLYQAVRKRNADLMDLYGVDIRVTGAADGDDAKREIMNSVQADDHAFDAICTQARDAATLAFSHYLYDLASVDSLQLDADWWDQNMVQHCTVNNKLYWLVGDFSTTDKIAVHVIAFDKQLLKKYANKIGEVNLYEEVENGTWTFDRMYALASVVNADLDGDGKMTEYDLFGLTHSQTVPFGYLNSSGIMLGETSDEAPYLRDTFWSEKTVDVFDKWQEMIRQKWTFDWHNEMNEQKENMFMNHQILFFLAFMDNIPHLRAAADGFEFGILPYPKFNEAQDNYISATSAWATNFLCMPINSPDPETTGMVFDALSSESVDTVTRAYYDINLIGKTTRDMESADMLDLIFSTRCYDIGAICDFASWESTLIVMTLTRSGNISSIYASKKKGIQKSIEKILKVYEDD